jgi:hypothetical protein
MRRVQERPPGLPVGLCLFESSNSFYNEFVFREINEQCSDIFINAHLGFIRKCILKNAHSFTNICWIVQQLPRDRTGDVEMIGFIMTGVYEENLIPDFSCDDIRSLRV